MKKLRRYRTKTYVPKIEALESRRLLAATSAVSVEDAIPDRETEFAQIGQQLIFARTDAQVGTELWGSASVDGPATLIRDIVPGPESSLIESLIVANETFYFTALTPNDYGSLNRRLWRTDGTAAGTFQLTDHLVAGELHAFGDRVVFHASGPETHGSIWISDGTKDGTQRIEVLTGRLREIAENSEYLSTDRHLFFKTDDGPYFLSDGTPEHAHRINGDEKVEQIREFHSVHSLSGGDVAVVQESGNDNLYAVGDRGVFEQLGQSLGLEFSRRLSTDHGKQSGDKFFFFATEPDGTVSLWRTDGAASDLAKVGTPQGQSNYSVYSYRILAVADERFLIVQINDALVAFDTHSERWISFDDSPKIAFPRKHKAIGTRFFYTSFDSSNNNFAIIEADLSSESWRPIVEFDSSHRVDQLAAFQGSLIVTYLDAEDDVPFVNIGRWDSQEFVLGDRFSIRSDETVSIFSMDGNRTLLVSRVSSQSSELRRSDSVDPFTIETIASARTNTTTFPTPTYRRNLRSLDQDHFVFTTRHLHGDEVWISDGTALGTKKVFATYEVFPDSSTGKNARIINLLVVDERAVFTVEHDDRPVFGTESRSLWSVGIVTPPRAIYRPGDGWGYLFDVIGSVNDTLVFVTQSSDGPEQTIWRTTNGAQSIETVTQITGVARRIDWYQTPTATDRLHFRVDTNGLTTHDILRDRKSGWDPSYQFGQPSDWNTSQSVWSTDGSTANTKPLVTPRELDTDTRSGYPINVSIVGELAWVRARKQYLEIPNESRLRDVPDSLLEDSGSTFPIGRRGGDWVITTSVFNSRGESTPKVYRLSDDSIMPVLIFESELLQQVLLAGPDIFLSLGPRDNQSNPTSRVYVLNEDSEAAVLNEGFQNGSHLVSAQDGLAVISDMRGLWISDGTKEGTDSLGQGNLFERDEQVPAFGLVLLAKDLLLNDQILPRRIDDIRFEENIDHVAITADASGTKLTARGSESIASTTSEADVHVTSTEAHVTIDVGSIVLGPTRHLNLYLADRTRITLTNGSGEKVIYNTLSVKTSTETEHWDSAAAMLVQFEGLEICIHWGDAVSGSGGVVLSDQLGTIEREFNLSELNDIVQLTSIDESPAIRVSQEQYNWAVLFPNSVELSRQPTWINLSSGSDRVVVDDLFNSAIADGLVASIDVVFAETINGIDRSTIDVTDSFDGPYTDGSTLSFPSRNYPPIWLSFSIGNQPRRNPFDIYDTNLSGDVTAMDAFAVINYLEQRSADRSKVSRDLLLDVSGDYKISALDALMIVNRLNRLDIFGARSIEGEIDTEDESISEDSAPTEHETQLF